MTNSMIDPNLQEDFDYFGELDESINKAQREANRAADSASKYFDWKQGAVRTLRFYMKKGQLPFLPSKVHWFDDMGDGKGGKLVCRSLIGESCPVCQYVAELELTGVASDGELARRINANANWLTLVEDQQDPGSIKILSVSRTLMKALVGLDDESEKTSIKALNGDFFHPQSGYLIKVIKHDGSPHYTAQVEANPKTRRIEDAPAKRELGPKLLDLAPEVMVPSIELHLKMVNYLKGIGEGVRTKEGGFKGGRGNAQPARVANAPQRSALPAQPARAAAPRAQDAVAVKIDDSYFEEG